MKYGKKITESEKRLLFRLMKSKCVIEKAAKIRYENILANGDWETCGNKEKYRTLVRLSIEAIFNAVTEKEEEPKNQHNYICGGHKLG